MLKTKGQTYSFTISRAEVLSSQPKTDGAKKRFLVSFVETESLENETIPKEPVTGVSDTPLTIRTAGEREDKSQSSRKTPGPSVAMTNVS